jgi:hypothetical protein
MLLIHVCPGLQVAPSPGCVDSAAFPSVPLGRFARLTCTLCHGISVGIYTSLPAFSRRLGAPHPLYLLYHHTHILMGMMTQGLIDLSLDPTMSHLIHCSHL